MFPPLALVFGSASRGGVGRGIKTGPNRFDVSSSPLQRFAMSGSALSSAALDERRRRILFRAWRRGVREMDLIMGRFADAYLPTMNEDELAEFERLLDVPDPQALAWIIGGEHPPREFDTPLFARLCGSR
jgi:antitoxin CptB